jgi:hypothetical protein
VVKVLRVSTAVVWLVVAACEVVPAKEARSRQVPLVSPAEASSDPDLAFPGRGRILFMVSSGPGYGWGPGRHHRLGWHSSTLSA